MVIVLIFVTVDLIIISTVTAVDSARYTVLQVQDGENAPSVNVSLLCNIAVSPTLPL